MLKFSLKKYELISKRYKSMGQKIVRYFYGKNSFRHLNLADNKRQIPLKLNVSRNNSSVNLGSLRKACNILHISLPLVPRKWKIFSRRFLIKKETTRRNAESLSHAIIFKTLLDLLNMTKVKV